MWEKWSIWEEKLFRPSVEKDICFPINQAVPSSQV